MAPHKRTEIRQLLVQRLQQAATLAGPRVYPGRLQPASEEDLWAGGVVFVYTGEERSPGGNRDPGEAYPLSHWSGPLRRTLDLDLLLVTPAFKDATPETTDYTPDALALIDQLARQVEDALEAYDPPGFGSSLLRLVLSQPEMGSATEAGMPVAKLLLRYQITYDTAYRAVSDPLVDNDSPDPYLQGAYPGGQVLEGDGYTGEACPVRDANIQSSGEPMPWGFEPGSLP